MSEGLDGKSDTIADQPNGEASGLHFALIVPVWGDHHTGLFLRYCVPFLLTDGNVGAFADSSLQIHVVSRRVDIDRMRQNITYQRLAREVAIVETIIDGRVDLTIPHRAMTECYAIVLRSLPASNSVITIFLTPDCVLSRNALRSVVRQIEQGTRAVMVCGLRLTLETAGPALDRVLSASGMAGRIAERELTALALEHLHPMSLGYDVASSEFNYTWPSHLYWIAPDRRWLVAHCFHLHPLAIRGIPDKIEINTTIDGDYLINLGFGQRDFLICANSDDILCIELSPEVKRNSTVAGPLTMRALVRFSVTSCNVWHRMFFETPILFRGLNEPVIPESVENEAMAIAAAVKRGSVVEAARHSAILAVRRSPRLERIARIAVRSFRVCFSGAQHLFKSGCEAARRLTARRTASGPGGI